MESFQCNDCEIKFFQSSHLKSHQYSKHTLERPFKCLDCDMKFAHSCSVKSHQRFKHTFEKPFEKPSDCDIGFVENSN